MQLIYWLSPSSDIKKIICFGNRIGPVLICKLRLHSLKCCCKGIYSYGHVISNYDAANVVVRVADLAWFSAYAVLRSVIKWKPYVYVGACVRACVALLKVWLSYCQCQWRRGLKHDSAPVCLLAGIAGSNPADGMDRPICFLWVLCIVS